MERLTLDDGWRGAAGLTMDGFCYKGTVTTSWYSCCAFLLLLLAIIITGGTIAAVAITAEMTKHPSAPLTDPGA